VRFEGRQVELRQLRYFVAVAEERHFGRAAERLRIAQSGLSQQIRGLERSLRVRLFDRGSRPIALTPAGEAFLEEARLVLELADRAMERARISVGAKKTILRFGGSSFGNGPVVEQVLRVARTRLPDVDLQVELDTTAHNVLALNRRALDVVFAYRPFESAKTPRFLRLGTVEMVLALPEGHRLTAAQRIRRDELLKEPFLVGPRSINPPLFDHILRSLFGTVDHPNTVDISDVGTARFRLVAEGVGISAVASPTEALLPIPGVVYRRVEDPAPTIEYGLLWFDEHVSPALSAFLDVAREIAEESDSTDDRLALPRL
jgi:DNA-binding transcriptional LysR family regulator